MGRVYGLSGGTERTGRTKACRPLSGVVEETTGRQKPPPLPTCTPWDYVGVAVPAPSPPFPTMHLPLPTTLVPGLRLFLT